MLVKELAERSGVSKHSLDNYLSVRGQLPSVEAAAKIAGALGVTVEYLVSGAEQAWPKDILRISQNLLRLDERDRKAIAAMVRTLAEQRENEIPP
jgi:transcriptional regulator with XRE-family HTH domain